MVEPEVAVVEAAAVEAGAVGAAVGVEEVASRNQPQLHLASETGMGDSRAIP